MPLHTLDIFSTPEDYSRITNELNAYLKEESQYLIYTYFPDTRPESDALDTENDFIIEGEFMLSGGLVKPIVESNENLNYHDFNPDTANTISLLVISQTGI